MLTNSDWGGVSKLYPLTDTYRADLEKSVDLNKLDRMGPLSYQHYLYALVRGLEPKVIVETGVYKGVSSSLIIAAMPPGAHLYSCDPVHYNQEAAARVIQKATGAVLSKDVWTFYGEKSKHALPKIKAEVKEWDMFIHDSDHEEDCMAFELAYGWEYLAPNGLLVCDDYLSCVGAKKPHKALQKFLSSVGIGIKDFTKLGSAAVIKKPGANGAAGANA
jgi:predicted O-methyltransferase YrrM